MTISITSLERGPQGKGRKLETKIVRREDAGSGGEKHPLPFFPCCSLPITSTLSRRESLLSFLGIQLASKPSTRCSSDRKCVTAEIIAVLHTRTQVLTQKGSRKWSCLRIKGTYFEKTQLLQKKTMHLFAKKPK